VAPDCRSRPARPARSPTRTAAPTRPRSHSRQSVSAMSG
jgi:hypothetical protein